MLIHSSVTVPVESRKRLEGHPYFRQISDKPGFAIFSLANCVTTDSYEEFANRLNNSIEIVRQMGIPAVFIPESMFQNVVSLKYTEDGEKDIQKLPLETYVNGLLGSWHSFQDQENFKKFLEHKYTWENQVRYGNIHTLKHFME